MSVIDRSTQSTLSILNPTFTSSAVTSGNGGAFYLDCSNASYISNDYTFPKVMFPQYNTTAWSDFWVYQRVYSSSLDIDISILSFFFPPSIESSLTHLSVSPDGFEIDSCGWPSRTCQTIYSAHQHSLSVSTISLSSDTHFPESLPLSFTPVNGTSSYSLCSSSDTSWAVIPANPLNDSALFTISNISFTLQLINFELSDNWTHNLISAKDGNLTLFHIGISPSLLHSLTDVHTTASILHFSQIESVTLSADAAIAEFPLSYKLQI